MPLWKYLGQKLDTDRYQITAAVFGVKHSGYCIVLLCDKNEIMVLYKIPHCGQFSLPLPLLFTKYNL